MSGTMKVSSDGTLFSGSLWQKVKRHFQRLRAKSTIKGTQLLDLNDDCLREIMTYLTEEDLCAVAQCSTESSIRLKDIATEVFRQSRKISNPNEMSVNKVHELRKVFVNFGSVILESVLSFTNLTSLNIDCHDQNVTQFIHDLNSLKSLTSLTLYSAYGDPEFMPALVKLKQLRSLALIMCYELYDLNPIADMNSLELLHIVDRYCGDKLNFDIVQLTKRLIHLKCLNLSGSKFRIDRKTYWRLMQAVKQREFTSHFILLIICAVDEDVAELHNAGFYRYLVHIPGLSDYCC